MVDVTPFTSRAQGDTAGWDVPLDAVLTAVQTELNAATAGVATNVTNIAALAVRPPKTVSTTTYTLVLTDQNNVLEFTNAAGCTVTIPLAASVAFPLGWETSLRQCAAGAVTVAQGSVTLNARGTLVSGGQWSGLGLSNRGTNLWWLGGDTTG